jgi:hypothetical protein
MAKPSRKLPAANFIKTSFKDVTVEDLLKIRRHVPREVVAALSSLAPEEVAALTTEEVLALYNLVSYLDDVNEIGFNLPLDFEAPEVDVASASFEKAELAKRKVADIKEPYRLFLELVRIYYGEERLTGPAVPALALGALILQDLNALFERFKDLQGEPPTDEEVEAGIEALHSFGPYGIVENIGAKYSVKPYDVFQWSAEEVYLELTYQQAKARYQENLREIERRQNQAPKK